MSDLTKFLSESLMVWLIIQVGLTLIFFWYLETYKQPSNSQLPKTAVILCLRGADPFLPHCVRSLLNQNYPEYDLKLIIDSREDPAFKIVQEVINETGAKNIQVSILKTVRHNCSLKCSALIQGVSDLDESYQVVALVDADTIVHSNWLKELVSPLMDGTTGVTTGNRWYVPTGKYWGSLVRYTGNISTVIQMFLFQIPWGGSLAIKKSVIQETQLIEKWEQVLSDDIPMHKILQKQGWKIKFIPSALIINREEINLSELLPSLQRLILCSRLYHPKWLALICEAVSSIVFPGLIILLTLGMLLVTEGEKVLSLVQSYSLYTLGLLLLILVTQRRIEKIVYQQEQPITEISLTTIIKMLIAIPLTQLVYGLAILSSISTSTLTWRGITYKINDKGNINLVAYHPYQWLDQPTDPKMSL